MESSKNRYFKNLADKDKDEGVQLELEHLLSMFEVAFTPKQRKNYLFYCLLYLFEERDHTIKNLSRIFFKNLQLSTSVTYI